MPYRDASSISHVGLKAIGSPGPTDCLCDWFQPNLILALVQDSMTSSTPDTFARFQDISSRHIYLRQIFCMRQSEKRSSLGHRGDMRLLQRPPGADWQATYSPDESKGIDEVSVYRRDFAVFDNKREAQNLSRVEQSTAMHWACFSICTGLHRLSPWPCQKPVHLALYRSPLACPQTTSISAGLSPRSLGSCFTSNKG